VDQETLVDNQIEDGQKLAEELARAGIEVAAAFWLKAAEDSQWYFYVVTPVVEEEGLVRAYRRVHTVIRRMAQPFWIDPFEVKLIGPANPLAQDVLAVQRRHRSRGPIRYGGKHLGGASVEGAYLYPLPAAAPGKGE
jgi:hypothetical protein